MTKLNKKRLSFVFVSIGILLSACTINEIPKKEKDPVNEWINTTMRTYYLWDEELPAEKKLDYSSDPEAFFNTMLSDKDGKTRNDSHYYYSAINKKSSVTKAYMGESNSFGFEFQYYYIRNLGIYALQILYVLPESPAGEKNIKRDNWIIRINNKAVPSLVPELLEALDTSSPVAVTFGISDNLGSLPKIDREVELTAAPVTDNPVFINKIIQYRGLKIGYLMYNHFTAGPSDKNDDETFNNSLREAFAGFKTANPDEFILDLRYNGGGLVSSAQLLATMLAPASALNDVFCWLEYNGQKQSYQDRSLPLDTRYMLQGIPGANLDLKRLFVITSSRTASASEAVINGLAYYLPLHSKLILIGEQTEGKNVGSVTFEDDRYEWELHPIVSRLYNKDKTTDYSEGFPPTPNFECDESTQSVLYELGDEREYMLKQALDYIARGTSPQSKSPSLRSPEITLLPLYNSLDRKRTKGVLLER